MWINENHCCTANNNVITFELKVYASGPVYARFIYLDTRHSIPPASSINDFGQSATVGYLRGSSVVAPSNLMYSFNAGVIFDGLVVDLVDPPFNVAAAAAPSGVASGGVVKLTASVTGGFSSPLSVTADTTALGGAPGTTLFDDGTNGDVVSGDGTYSRDVLVTTTALGVRWIPVYVVDASPYQLNALIQVSVAPPNDECFAAALVNFGTNGPFSNEGATTSLPVDTGAGCTVSLGTNDVWFVYFSACTGPTTVATGCTGYDTVLGVYDNCGGTLLACNDNATGCGTGGSSATFTASAGGLYFIRVAAKTAGTFGTFNVNVSTGAYTFAFSSPLGAGSIQANVSNGTPFGAYIMALTLAPGVFPNGWLGGLDIPFGDFIAQATAGFPFTGGLDACGGAQIGPFPGLPSGLQLWGTSIDMPTLFGAVNKIAPAVTHVIP
ncbi:MAG TPA: choice-of-anchor X domain-containing protein [Planctomycetota bacterium]|nr:choice-of-anchor X domain-containing protein [Planctomycetota bacterium]